VVYGSKLFLMAFSAFFNAKSLGLAIVAGATGFTFVHLRHLERSFLHGEEFGLRMAVGARKTGIGVGFAIEHNLALCSPVIGNFFRGTRSHHQPGKT
jgi:hypothetical protein